METQNKNCPNESVLEVARKQLRKTNILKTPIQQPTTPTITLNV